MPNPTVRSYSSSYSTDGNHTVDKPAGLAVGDLLVWLVATREFITVPTPENFLVVYVSDHAYCFTKVADADDVKASTFTLTNTDLHRLFVVLYAVQSAGALEYCAAADTAFVTGFTPVSTGDLLLAFAAADDSRTFHTTNNNPLWTSDASSGAWEIWSGCHATYGTGPTGVISTGDYSEQVIVVAVAPGGTLDTSDVDMFLDGMWG